MDRRGFNPHRDPGSERRGRDRRSDHRLLVPKHRRDYHVLRGRDHADSDPRVAQFPGEGHNFEVGLRDLG